MARRNDRRVLRTRKLLRESILALVLEKGYDDISIQDITDRANLGRATFYLHYREKDDLLADLIRQFMEEFIASGPQNPSDKSYVRDIRSVQRLFEYIETRYDVYRILLIGKGFVVATRQLHRLLQKGIAKGLAGKLTESGKELALPPDFLENYLAGSLVTLLYWWLEADMPYTPADMARMYQHLSWLDAANFDRLTGSPIISAPNAKKNKRQPEAADYLSALSEDEDEEPVQDEEN